MLALLHLAAIACEVPMLEKDLLKGAQSDSFGYLTEYRSTIARFPMLNARKVYNSLRPINVPFKIKWLREASRNLDQMIKLNLLDKNGLPRLST